MYIYVVYVYKYIIRFIQLVSFGDSFLVVSFIVKFDVKVFLKGIEFFLFSSWNSF